MIIRKYIYTIAAVVILGILSSSIYNYKKAMSYKSLYEVAASNIKAYNSELDNNHSQSIVFQETIDNLSQDKDSLLHELLEVKKSKNIKDKNLQSMSYQTSKATRTDTINTRDTIFLDKVSVDTTITDKWYSMNLLLKYPTTIVVTPTFNSERYVLISTKRETINKPSKVFFIRWFQKKHTVINVDVEEKNPYINIEKQKFIKIIK